MLIANEILILVEG